MTASRAQAICQFVRHVLDSWLHVFRRASQIRAEKVYYLRAGFYDLDVESTCRSGPEIVDSTRRRESTN